MAINYRLIGLIGMINLAVLSVIVLWRTIRWYMSWDGPCTLQSFAFRKKLAFHLLLICAAVVDMPLYVSFFMIEDYALIPYSFHKFTSAFVFAALSVTISDWAAVLHDIHEYNHYPWVFGKAGLFTINAVFFCISFVNFVLCYVSSSLEDYTASPIYVVTIFLQIAMSIVLTCLMLHAGLKLYSRIQGAAGNLEAADRRSRRRRNQPGTAGTPTPRNQFANQFDGSAEFRGALRNLNLVMATCTLCILLQMVMMTLNYALGYAHSTSDTLGPATLYWTLNNWIPLWGPVLSLLYLCRTHSNRKKARFNTMRIHSNEAAFNTMRSPLIDSGDLSLSEDILTTEDRAAILQQQSDSGGTQGMSTSNSILQSILSTHNRESNPAGSSARSSGGAVRPSNPSGFNSNRAMGRSSDDDHLTVGDGENLSETDTEGGTQVSQHLAAEDEASLGDYLISPDQSLLYNLYAHTMGSSPPHQGLYNSRDGASGSIEEPDIRDTLPSALYFPSFGNQHQDFSYRGGDDHNGHFG